MKCAKDSGHYLTPAYDTASTIQALTPGEIEVDVLNEERQPIHEPQPGVLK